MLQVLLVAFSLLVAPLAVTPPAVVPPAVRAATFAVPPDEVIPAVNFKQPAPSSLSRPSPRLRSGASETVLPNTNVAMNQYQPSRRPPLPTSPWQPQVFSGVRTGFPYDDNREEKSSEMKSRMSSRRSMEAQGEGWHLFAWLALVAFAAALGGIRWLLRPAGPKVAPVIEMIANRSGKGPAAASNNLCWDRQSRLAVAAVASESTAFAPCNPVTSITPQPRAGWAARRRDSMVALQAKKKSKGGRGSSAPRPQRDAPVSEGKAYSQETREIILEINGIDKVAKDGKKILNDVHLGMYMGAKIGILGVNGAGKSTVMRILAGKDTDFLGELKLKDGIEVGFLEQEPELEAETVIGCLEPAVGRIKAMIKDFEDISMEMTEPDCDIDDAMERMDKLQAKIDSCGGWEVDDKLAMAMKALRCPPPDAKVAVLSGGERRRVAICRLLLTSPDILLLDEPTNHLDAQSVAWLERYLADFKGTVVAITHDRYFLDNVAGWILELDQGKGLPFEGNYSAWLENKAKRLKNEAKRKKELEKQIDQELSFIRKNAGGGPKKGKARLRRYDDLCEKQNDYIRTAETSNIIIKPGPRLGNDVISLENICKGFEDRLLINKANFKIPPGAVVGIVGPNGAGKTTLFKMIMGVLEPDAGTLKIGDTVAPMYVDQGRDGLDGDKTVYQEIADGDEMINLGGREIHSRAYCGWFNFKGTIQNQLVSSLSGGERNRLQLAKTLRLGGNVLMLDEPSNDLDVETLRALEEAIENFAGTVLCVSHDRWFLDRVATHILAYEGGSELYFFEGDYAEYERDRIRRTGVEDPMETEYLPMPTF